ncbi:MAG: hypothetical protein ACRDU0_16585, partial [Mycobacterium sp.]
LPGGVKFAEANGDVQQTSDGWSKIVVFQPDGTASADAEVKFQVQGTRSTSIQLRGLTGAVTVQKQDGGGGR